MLRPLESLHFIQTVIYPLIYPNLTFGSDLGYSLIYSVPPSIGLHCSLYPASYQLAESILIPLFFSSAAYPSQLYRHPITKWTWTRCFSTCNHLTEVHLERVNVIELPLDKLPATVRRLYFHSCFIAPYAGTVFFGLSSSISLSLLLLLLSYSFYSR